MSSLVLCSHLVRVSLIYCTTGGHNVLEQHEWPDGFDPALPVSELVTWERLTACARELWSEYVLGLLSYPLLTNVCLWEMNWDPEAHKVFPLQRVYHSQKVRSATAPFPTG